MAIDDPIDATQAQIAAEERSASCPPILYGAYRFLEECLPGEAKTLLGPLDFWIGRAEEKRRAYLLDVLTAEIKRLGQRPDPSSQEYIEFIRQQFVPLLMDGMRKAEQARSEAKIERVARILAHAFEICATPSDAEIADELMRVAVVLSDNDVSVLGAIHDLQSPHYSPDLGAVPPNDVHSIWMNLQNPQPGNSRHNIPQYRRGFETLSRFPKGELIGIMAKLQAFGLVAQIDSNPTKLPPLVIPYVILKRGMQFVEFGARHPIATGSEGNG